MPKFLPESFKDTIFDAQKDICFPCAIIKGCEGNYYLAKENADGTYTDIDLHFPKQTELKDFLLNQYTKHQLIKYFGTAHINICSQLIIQNGEEPFDFLEFVPLVDMIDLDENVSEVTRQYFLSKQQEISRRYSDIINDTDTCSEEITAVKNNAFLLNEFCNQVKILINQNSVKYMGNLPEFKKSVDRKIAETKTLYNLARKDVQNFEKSQKYFKGVKKDHDKNVNELKQIIAQTNIPLEKFGKLFEITEQIKENLELCEKYYLQKIEEARPMAIKAIHNYKDLDNLYRAKIQIVSETHRQNSN